MWDETKKAKQESKKEACFTDKSENNENVDQKNAKKAKMDINLEASTTDNSEKEWKTSSNKRKVSQTTEKQSNVSKERKK